MEALRVRCFSCHVGMRIKGEHAGKLKKCPACGTVFLVPRHGGEALPPPETTLKSSRRKEEKTENKAEKISEPPAASEVATLPPSIQPDMPESIMPVEQPKRLEPRNRYLVLDSQKVVAFWQLEKGWQVFHEGKWVPVKRQPQLLPKQGDFRLVELDFTPEGENIYLTRLRIYQLAQQYSISKLAGDDTAILSTITRSAGLLGPQKRAIMDFLKTQFMRETWTHTTSIYDFLLGFDAHSWNIGE